MSQQIDFHGGKLISRTKIEKKELVSAFYILAKAEIGDNLQRVTKKLPAWVKYKNNVKRIFDKLVKLGIIRIIDATGGARITEISKSAEMIAIDAIGDIDVWQELLNSETEWFPTYEDI